MTPKNIRPSLPALKLASAFAALAFSSSAFAADAYWNNTSTNWNTSTATWNTAADGSGSTNAWVDGDSAIFSAGSALTGSYTLTNGGVTVDNITQQEGRVRISSGTITLADSAAVFDVQTRVSADYDLRIDSVIVNSSGGASSITKNGAGVLMLTGPNTYTGGFTLNAGSVFLENQASAFGSGGTLTLAGGNLVRSYSSTNGAVLTIANAIHATGSTNVAIINQGNNGNFVFSGAVTGSGTIRVDNAAVAGFSSLKSETIRFTGNLSAFTGTFAHNNLSAAGNRLRFGSSGTGQTVDLSNGKLALSGATTGTGNPVDLADGFAGTMKIGELSGTGGVLRAGWTAGAGNNTTFEVGALNTNSTFAGVIQNNVNGSGGLSALNKVGSGTLTFTGANLYTGGTTVTNGTLLLGASNVLANGGAITLSGGTLAIGDGFTDTLGTLDLNASSTIMLGLGSSLIFADSSALDWSSFGLTIGGSFVSGSSINFGSAAGLSVGQLGQISIAGFTNIGLDAGGYLTASAIPEPGAFAAIAAFCGLGAAALRRRRG